MLFFDSSPYYAGMKIAIALQKKTAFASCIFMEGSKDTLLPRGWGRPNVNSDIFTTVPIVDL